MSSSDRAKLVGINHVALEVGEIEQALDFYGRIFEIKLRGRGEGAAFIDMGDQFIALMQGRDQAADAHRHFGLVVEDRSAVRALAEAAGARLIDGPGLDFLDPWGNRVQVVAYRDIQFTKTDAVLAAMGIAPDKTEDARRQLSDKGMG